MIETLIRENVKKIPPYIAGKNADSLKNKEQLQEIFKLSSNENPLGPGKRAVEAMQTAAARGNLYPDFYATDLRSKIAGKMGFQLENVITACGSSMILELLGQVFVCPGDEVIFCVPTFMLYAGITTGNDGVPVMLPLNQKLEYDLDGMEKAVTSKTKMILICNPNNPTGTALPYEKLEAFIQKIPDRIIVVIDEAYIEYSEHPAIKTMLPLVKEKDNLIILRTFSKIFGLAGLRIGYGIAQKEIIDVLFRKLPAFNTNFIAIEAAKAALDDEEHIRQTLEVNREGKRYLTDELKKMGFYIYDSQTNFLYVDTHMDAAYISDELEKRGIIVRGNFKLSRITIGTRYQNKKLIEAFGQIKDQQGCCI